MVFSVCLPPPPPPIQFYYCPFQCSSSVAVSYACHCLSAYYLFVLFRIALWSYAGKELSSWLSACAVLLYTVLIFVFLSRVLLYYVLIVCVPFPSFTLCRLNCLCSFPDWCLWQDLEFDLSVPDHCLFINFADQCIRNRFGSFKIKLSSDLEHAFSP